MQNDESKNRAQSIEDLPDNYVACRRFHLWIEQSDTHIVTGLNGQIVQHRENDKCKRCPRTRYRVIETQTGRIISIGGIGYPKPYQMDHYVSPAEVRVEAFKRRNGLR